MNTLPTPDLATRLRAAAKGVYDAEAATELLIAHGTWLHRPDFLDTCTETFTGYDHIDGEAPMVSVNWPRRPRVPRPGRLRRQ